MDVVSFIKQRIRQDHAFFGEVLGQNDDHARLQYLAKAFFSDMEDWQRALYARLLVSYTMSQHAKSGASAFGDILHTVEASKEYAFKGQRLHRFHLVNVYLLGLALYSALPNLQTLLSNEIGDREWELLSGGSKRNEFIFRWKLASLFHDVGTSIALYGPNEQASLRRALVLFQMGIGQNWLPGDWENIQLTNIHRLSRGMSTFDVLRNVDQAQGDLTERLSQKLAEDGFVPKRKEKAIHYDHGLTSAALLLKALDEMYRHYDDETLHNPVVFLFGRRVSFRREFFDCSIAAAAHAIALHNIDFYEEDWQKTPVLARLGVRDFELYDFAKHPLASLLKLCDTLQEWDKPKVRGLKKRTKPKAIDLRIDGDTLQLSKFPKAEKLKAQLEKFFQNAEFISLL